MSYVQSIIEGRNWARYDDGASRATLNARMEKFRAAWGDSAAHAFWTGAFDALQEVGK